MYYKGLLYHGTDRKIIEMTNEERQERLRICDVVSAFSYDILSKKHVKFPAYSEEELAAKRKLEDIWNNLWILGINRYTGRINGNTLFQYDSLYVTNNFTRAESYAIHSPIIGERGNVAVLLYEAASRFVDLKSIADDSIRVDLEKFEVIKKEKFCPIVVVFEKVPKAWIKHENGADISWEFEDFYAKGNPACSFRLSPDEPYDFATLNIIDIE